MKSTLAICKKLYVRGFQDPLQQFTVGQFTLGRSYEYRIDRHWIRVLDNKGEEQILYASGFKEMFKV